MPYADRNKQLEYHREYSRKNSAKRKIVKLQQYNFLVNEGASRTCVKCGTIKHIKDFYPYSNHCKECHLKRSRKWHDQHPDTVRRHVRGWHVKTKYGITYEEEQNLLRKQGFKCAICGDTKKLSIDHDHKSGKIRMILCGKCNTGIGMFNDSIMLLRKAVKYLELYE